MLNINKVFKILRLLLALILFYNAGVNGQTINSKNSKERRMIADSVMTIFKEGALVVKLKSHHKKIASLNAIISNRKNSKKERKRAEKLLHMTERDRDTFNVQMVTGMHANYTFNPFYVLYDTSAYMLNNSIKNGYFLNANLEVDPTIVLEKDHYFFLQEKTIKTGNGKSTLVLKMTDQYGNDLEPPFPDAFRIMNTRKAFMSFFSSGAYSRKDGAAIVRKMEEAFRKYALNIPN